MTVRDSLTVTDNRTGKSIECPVFNGEFVRATDLKDLGIMSYDPGFMNTSIAKSKICYIDGDKGILEYRGYNIEDLVDHCTFLEVAFLLIHGDLPTKEQLAEWEERIMHHTYLHVNLEDLMKTFRYDAHPMGMVISSVAALSTFYPNANPALQGPCLYDSKNDARSSLRNKQLFRILGKVPTIAACAYRHRIGRPYNTPVNTLGYAENFLYMLDRLSEVEYRPDPRITRAMEILFILHAEHELNCSTAAMRHLASSAVDPYTAVAGAAGALYGPLHGGANEAVLEQLKEIGKPENVNQFLDDVKNKKRKLMGFGHRVYKNYDPRAKILKKVAMDVFDTLGTSPLMEIALALEKAALADDYFVSRKLYPNVDFFTGMIYHTLGFPSDYFPVLFCIPRVAGWLAHWIESLSDPELRIYRPRQVYEGARDRKFIPMENRVKSVSPDLGTSVSEASIRRNRGADHHYGTAK
eukprot:ANDGO_05912.mRNA.1 Citrate synthase